MTLREIRIPNFTEHKLRIDTLLSSYQMMKGMHKGIPKHFKKPYFEARRKEGTRAFRLIRHYKKFQATYLENRRIKEIRLILKATERIVFELSKKDRVFLEWFKDEFYHRLKLL